MKLRMWHHFGVAVLATLLSSGLTSCSDDQQVDDEIVANQDSEGGEDGNAAEGQNADINTSMDAPIAPPVAQAPVGGQDELQEIIDGMNGQPVLEGEGVQAPVVEAPPVNPAATNPVQQQVAAAGMAAAPGLPELGSKMSYVIKRGDTLASVAMKVYGDMQKWREIAEFTGMANPNMIYPGDIVYYQLTDQTMAFASAYESVKRSQVVVQSGDTLSTISSRVLGRSSDWKLIWRQNDSIDNPDRLIVGQTLYYVDPNLLMSDLGTDTATKQLVDAHMQQSNEVVTTDINQSEYLNSADNEFDSEFAMLKTVGNLPVI